MCGKFTAQATWRQVVDFSQPLTGERSSGGEGSGDGEVHTYRVNGMLPVIVWDHEADKRRIVPMRWGFPDRRDWRRPQPIHARAETIDELRTFRDAFNDGQRGIVVFETFNEGEEVTKPSGAQVTQQWTVNPGDGQPRGFAFIWRRFEIAGLPAPLLACAMVTVPANELIRRTIKAREDDPRMPAILEDLDVWRHGWASPATIQWPPRRCSRRLKASRGRQQRSKRSLEPRARPDRLYQTKPKCPRAPTKRCMLV